MFLIKNLILIIVLPFYSLSILVKKIFSLKIYTFDCSRLGNCVTVPEVFLKKYKSVYNNFTTIVFLQYHKEPANKFVIKKFCKLFKLKKIIVINYSFIVKILDFCGYKIFKEHFSTPLGLNRKDFDIYKTKKLFKLDSSEIEEGYKKLKELKISKQTKWICIHNRDEEFLKKYHNYRSWKYHNYRDFSVNDYELAIKLFLKNGFYVFRIGKGSDHTLKISKKDKRVIDFTNHNLRTDFLETFLINHCSFYLGTSSGPVKIARMLRKKIFAVNISPLESVFVDNWKYPVLFKKVLNLKNKRYLSIKEIVDNKIFKIFEVQKLKNNKLKFVNNTKKEILDYSYEILRNLNSSKISFTKSYINKRKKYINLLKKDKELRSMKYNVLIGEKFFRSIKID